MTAYTAKDVTLYVPYYNAQDTIEACVESLQGQSVTPAQLLIINDGSTEQLPAHIRDSGTIDIIEHHENKGLACARNTALETCDTALLASVDADVVTDPDWLKTLLHCLNAKDVSGCGGRMDEKYQVTLGDRWRSVHMAQHWGKDQQANPRFLYGCNTLFITEALREAGGYPTTYRTNYEDGMISRALYEAGHHLHYIPAAHCQHLRQDTWRTVLQAYWEWHLTAGLNRGELASKDSLIKRIGSVAFGIFDYRQNLDREFERKALLGLDACIPWVFAGYDLAYYAEQTGEAIFNFPGALESHLPPILLDVLPEMLPPAETVRVDKALEEAYCQEFVNCLRRFGWASCSGYAADMVHYLETVDQNLVV
jgi:cellulose synthase/poly-beta-1,6-N-acetylglucosamine synthase-like glycosyltransferase